MEWGVRREVIVLLYKFTQSVLLLFKCTDFLSFPVKHRNPYHQFKMKQHMNWLYGCIPLHSRTKKTVTAVNNVNNEKNMKKVQGNDSFQRINYLYQASKYIVDKNPALSSYYGNLIINIAKKSVLKIHPDIKRQICKKCRCMMITGVSAKFKIKNKRKAKIIEWTCNTCSAKKTFPAEKDKDHRIWLEKPESVVEIVS